MRPRLIPLAAAGLLAACNASPEYHLLPPPVPVGQPLAARAATVSVSEIALPNYVEAAEIARIAEDGAVRLDADALWADQPRRALTRHLVAALDDRLNATVASEPWPEFERPSLRVEVTTDRLIANPDGGVNFSGQYLLIAAGSGRIAAASRFEIDVPAQGEGYAGLMAGHSRAVERLADAIAADVVRVGSGGV